MFVTILSVVIVCVSVWLAIISFVVFRAQLIELWSSQGNLLYKLYYC